MVSNCGGFEKAQELGREKVNLAIQNFKCLPRGSYQSTLKDGVVEARTSSLVQAGTIDGVVQLHSAMARLRVHIFLSGLDSVFDQIRGEILRKDPKLELENAYAFVRTRMLATSGDGGRSRS
uniref:Uncharacterized protein n=1 Tax=Salix viminalis TaxID=40686 RepID=A0A6N2KLX5_SALVM